MRPTRISFINQKGGCGKSSTCFHLGGWFAAAGFEVLLVDADPQGSLSQAFLGSSVVEQLAASETLAAVFDDSVLPIPDQLIQETAFPHLSLLPANQALAEHNRTQPESTGLKQFCLRSLLDGLSRFDFVFVDCPPNLYQCTWNALIAADGVVIPVPPEDFGTQGLPAVHQAIEHASLLNPSLELLGHLVTRADSRLIVHRAYEQRLRELYGDSVLTTVIPEASAFKLALACRQPVTVCQPKSKAASLTDLLGREILQKIDGQIAARSVA